MESVEIPKRERASFASFASEGTCVCGGRRHFRNNLMLTSEARRVVIKLIPRIILAPHPAHVTKVKHDAENEAPNV